ncbi:MAG: hypothetical protein AB1716_12230 [Planctomycetota bacterium]
MNSLAHGLVVRSWGRSIPVLFAVWLVVPLALGVDIQPRYDANVTAAQRAVIEAKIALWEGRLPHQNPEHVVVIDFRNADLGLLFFFMRPGVEPLLTYAGDVVTDGGTTLAETDNFTNDADGRPTGARITINNNAAVPWYEGLDPNVPNDKYDLYTVINHELCHALGFTTQNPRFNRNVVNTPGGGRKYEGGGAGGTPGGTLTPPGGGTHLDPNAHPGDLMNPELPKGTRRTPSQTDIDILLDDVWKYPTIQGTLSNFDVWNRSGLIANDFQVTLGGLLASSIGNIWQHSPFGGGTATQAGNSVVVKWGPGSGQVNPGDKGHFGFTIAGGITPLSYVFEWTQNNTVISQVPVSGTTWRTLVDGSVRNRITNDQQRTVWVYRRINFSEQPITLEDLVVGAPLEQTAVPLGSAQPLEPGQSITFDYPLQQDALWGVVMVAEFFEDVGGAPGLSLGVWLDAAQLPPGWFDNFDSYALGSINGQGGWKGWGGVPAAAGTVTNELARSAPQSQKIEAAHDSVREYTGFTTGVWLYTAHVYVPGNFQGGGTGNDRGSYFILLSRYTDPGTTNVWTVQSAFNSDNQRFEANVGSSTKIGVPYVTDAWSELMVRIDLTNDWTQLYYNGTLLDDPNVPNHPTLGGGYRWTRGVFGSQNPPGPLAIGAVDLYANSSTPVYYDDLSLAPVPPICRGDCNCDGVVDFGDINPFVTVLSGGTPCNFDNCDVNGDGVIDFGDINPFVALLSAGGGPCP